jgi:hypothetical protein
MVIFWWVVFCIWATLIPAALLNGRAFLSGLPNNFYLNLPYGIVGAITALSSAFVHQIDWWWSLIFLIVMWFSVTLSAIISAIGVWAILLLLLYTSGIIG